MDSKHELAEGRQTRGLEERQARNQEGFWAGMTRAVSCWRVRRGAGDGERWWGGALNVKPRSLGSMPRATGARDGLKRGQ